MEPLWSLYNKFEKLRVDDLKTEHVRIVLLAIPSRRMGDWFACREGDLRWQPIAEIVEFYEDVRALKGLNPHELSLPRAAGDDVHGGGGSGGPERRRGQTLPQAAKRVPEHRPLFEDDPERDADELNVITSRTKERRSAQRYQRTLSFAVRIGEKSFVAETRDISISGLSLSEPLPKWVGKEFRARLQHAGKSVRIACIRVSTNKVQFLDADAWEIIRNWIVNW